MEPAFVLLAGLLSTVVSADAAFIYPTPECDDLVDCVERAEPGTALRLRAPVDQPLEVTKEMRFEPFLPGPPTHLSVTDIGHTEMTLRWRDNRIDETGYYVKFWDTAKTAPPREFRLGPSTEMKRVDSLLPARGYAFTVCAVLGETRDCYPYQDIRTATTAPEARFRVDDVWPSPDPPTAGECMRVKWRECNDGEKSAGHVTAVYVNSLGLTVHSARHGSLDRGECEERRSGGFYIPYASGGVEVTVLIDSTRCSGFGSCERTEQFKTEGVADKPQEGCDDTSANLPGFDF